MILELKQNLYKIKNNILALNDASIFDKKMARLLEIDDLLKVSWNDIADTVVLVRERAHIARSTEVFTNLSKDVNSAIELLSIMDINDTEMIKELATMATDLSKRFDAVRIETMFSDKQDCLDCFIEINAGAGGTDSQDWAAMLLRMYCLWCGKSSADVSIISKIDGESAGIKQATLSICGHLAYGKLKHETGVHRLVRISPFNANGKRHTSFASVFCYPIIENNATINIDEKDIRVDLYRSSGPGGQSVNTTESAVRITHLPSGIVVQSQNQRSQIQNRAEAMKVLRSRLYNLQDEQDNAARKVIENQKTDNSWGHQIRNYVMHPYQLVKDSRSGYETSQIDNVLNGDLDDIINSLVLLQAK